MHYFKIIQQNSNKYLDFAIKFYQNTVIIILKLNTITYFNIIFYEKYIIVNINHKIYINYAKIKKNITFRNYLEIFLI